MNRHFIVGSILSLLALLTGCATNRASSTSASDGAPPLKVFVNYADLDAGGFPRFSTVNGPKLYVVIENVSAGPVNVDDANPRWLCFEFTDENGHTSYVGAYEPAAVSAWPSHTVHLQPGQIAMFYVPYHPTPVDGYMYSPFNAFPFPEPDYRSRSPSAIKKFTMRAAYGNVSKWDKHSPSWHDPAKGWVDEYGQFIGVVTSAPFEVLLANNPSERSQTTTQTKNPEPLNAASPTAFALRNNPEPLNVASSLFENLKYSLEQGAAVYVCKVEKREPSPESDNAIERGKVTLTVVKTLVGSDRSTLALPYAFPPAGFLKSDGPLIWPSFQVGDNLMCVVIPGAEDTSAPHYTDISEAASRVVNIDKDPTAAREIEAACAEYNKNAAK